MSLVLQDRVRETTNTTGTGTFTLLGAVTGYQSFSVIGNGNTCFYACADQGGPNWEVGIGTYSSGTLARTTVLSSSNSGSLVNFTAGTKDVFVTQPSEKAVYLDGSGNITPSSVGPLTVSSLTDTGLTAGRVTYATTSGLLTDSANMTFNGTSLTLANDASISGLTVGKGGGALASNTAVGLASLPANTTGAQNTAVGQLAMVTNTTGSDNSAFGFYSLFTNTTGSQNTAIGRQSLFSNTTASNNTAVGYQAGYSNTTGTASVAVGYQALYTNTGAGNTALGTSALALNTSATGNTALGYQAGASNTTGLITAVGYQALNSNTTGAYNAAFGAYVGGTTYGALQNNSTGSYNSAFGYGALGNNTTASNNTAVGYQAGYSNTTGTPITAVGYQALGANTTGPENTALGYQAALASTTGGGNTYIGYQAGIANTTGGGNVSIGRQAGNNITTGAFNVCIGYTSTVAAAADNYEIVICALGSVGKGSSTGFISPNGGGVYQGNNSATWSITSDARLKKNIVDNTIGLSAITAIQVRNFEYRTANEVTDLPKEQAINIKGIQLGAIAQELALVLPDCVKTESTGVMSVDTTNITWHLINAVKELSAKVTALEAKLGA